jgi:hypothetical protein
LALYDIYIYIYIGFLKIKIIILRYTIVKFIFVDIQFLVFIYSIMSNANSNNCNGSWKESARNIKYNGNNTVECELKSINDEWMQNKLKFIDHIEYNNNNGKFEWDNCSNNIQLNDTSHESISTRYKKVSVQRCLDNLTNEFDDWFTIEKEYINSIKKKCISISLFKKNVDNTHDNEFDVDITKWCEKYLKSLIKNLNNFNSDNICVNLYLANDLSILIPRLTKYKFLNIFLMKSSSIGASPGSLWRYINITNKLYDYVFIADIDEPWDWINDWDNSDYDNKVCTLKAGDGIISNNPYVPSLNFTTIISSHIKCCPSKFNYNIINVMKGFISLCKKREKSNHPWGFDDDDAITYWNHPVGNHIYGWGRITTMYGFDEFFLKHVIYHDVYPDIKNDI